MDLAGMLALQGIDIGLDQAVHARDRLPAVLEARAADDEVARLVAARRAIEVRQAEIQSELDRIDSQSAEMSHQRERLEKQLKTVIAPREAEALQHEIETLSARRSELDDRGLELLEQSSASDDELATIDVSISSARMIATEARERAGSAEREADRDLDERRAARVANADALDPTTLAEYERRRRAFGGIAVATIAHGSCTACHMELSVAETDDIKRLPADAVPECPHCARILVR